MARRTFDTLGEVLFWSYANLAMADAAVRKGDASYGISHFMIRAKLFKNLCDGTTSPRSLYFDERDKMLSQGRCSYCGANDHPSLDHLLARHAGGTDSAENLVPACRRCNSSKGKRDVLEWAFGKGVFLPLSVLRRYLKLSIRHSVENDLLDLPRDEFASRQLPFSVALVPMKYPRPDLLIWSH